MGIEAEEQKIMENYLTAGVYSDTPWVSLLRIVGHIVRKCGKNLPILIGTGSPLFFLRIFILDID